ncbi:hypothetical protein MN116_004945 [Schistosoma mekongi]|uniref:DEP domain-containing protein n=1 Tax=Schistosoma mekongi TaxID=38744 RepID=A0AAE1ZCY2_SCHME|nr:hypothetical protein MN116_004945 [Schistosoma mekongi]
MSLWQVKKEWDPEFQIIKLSEKKVSTGYIQDVIISSRGGHNIDVGDVIEVYHAEDAHHALFLVTTLNDDLQNRDVISVEQSLAHTFKLQQHKNVIVNVINKETVSLDLVELYFRDQYFSRRDFCNMTQKLIGTVVHVNKKLTCNEMRTQVGDLWRLGERYSCGYIDSKTKIIFRSSTAVIHIFIQMSQEMWWFDNNGDLYLEKAFKFLSKLFLKFWPENNCNHDTTVVFFTRIYIDDLPSAYSQLFKQDVLGRHYEDFYRVIIQNERFATDDWKRELGRMQYEVLEFENNIYSYLRNTYPLMNEESNKTKLNICTAMDANLLEVLNMAINLYSGYNVDRNFDRTGKLLFVISPGSGVYHVNENLLLLTKKRVLDLGVGVDLICLAEQPLHVVPLFKIVSESFTNPEEYVAPHWINCSYFKSSQELKYIEMGRPFPRVKVISCRHSDDIPLSKFYNETTNTCQSWNQQKNASDKSCEDTITTSTVTITTNSSLPIYRIAYPSYQLRLNRTKGKKSHLPNEDSTKSHDFITRDCSSSIQLNENSTSHNMISSIIDQSSSVESNHMSTCCLTNITQIGTNTISTISKAKRKASTSSHMNLSRSYDSYITSTNSLHPILRSTAASGSIVSNSHLLSLDKWQHVRCENVPPYSQPSSQLHTLLSRVPSIGGNSDSSSTGGFTTVTSLPSVRERCMENYDTALSTTDRSGVLSIPVTPRSSRNRTQSFNEEQCTKLSCIDNGHFRQCCSPMNDGTNYNVNREDSDEVVCLHDNAISRCRTMDVILSNGQPSQSSWSIVTPQHFTLRSCNSMNRRTSGILSLSGSTSQTLPFTRRKSTTTLYSTSNTPIHSAKFNSNTRNSTTYVTSSLVSGAYFPFGVGSNSHRIPISAGQRRWALVRPSDEYGSTITPHCIITSTDDIDFLYPAALPYNLCQIWTLYFDFLRARLLDKKDSKHNKQLCHLNQNTVKHNNYTTSNMNNTTTISNNCIIHPVSDIQQSNIRNTNVRISTKGLSGYIERTNGNQNILNGHIPLVPPTYTNFNPSQYNINISKHNVCNNYNQVSSITSSSAASIHQHQQHNYQQSIDMHDKIDKMKSQENSNSLQLSENSLRILQNLLETIKNAMFTYSAQLSASSMPSLSTTFWYQNVITVNSNNKSSDDQNLSNLPMNNFNKSTNYKLMIPKRVDDLRNMLQLIGVDWKSLIVPACLPVDTDYFPDTYRLRSEWYTLHDYRVVPSGMSPDEWASVNNHGLVEPGALYNRRQLTAREVFQEMVLQRISQGFQLCHEVVHNPTNSNNVEHHCVTSINTSPTILQNDTLSTSSNNKTKTLSVIKQTNERHSSSNSPHSLYNSRRAPNISTTTINATTFNSYSSTNRNAINPQFLKSTNLYLPTRALKLTTVNNSNNNNTQYSRGSTSAYNGRVLGVGLTINPSTRSGSQSNSCNNTGRVIPAMRPGYHYTNSKHDNSVINTMVNPLSKFGDTDHLLKTSNTRKLSIGHLFHLISLDEDSIGVTSYRQIDKLIEISYSYALQVPDAKSYVSFHTNFTSDSTAILNWNYLDNYLCNRGISDSFRLLPNLKFWRSRFFVLPIFSNETRRLTEAIRDNLTGQRIPCDVYESDYMNMNREKTCEKFVHFIESINRVRRTLITSRKLNRQLTIEKSDIHRSNNTVFSSNAATITSDTAPSMHCTTSSKLKTTNSLTATTYTRSPVIISLNTTGSLNETNDQNIHLTSSRTVNQASIVKTDNFYSTTSLPNISGMSYQSTEDQAISSGQIVHITPTIINTRLLNSNTNTVYYLVALMMVDNDNGLPFISATTTDAFPNYTFISIDAVNWVIKWFPDDIGSIEQAVLYLQQMLEAGWICHTSGNPKHAFIYGTYFYTLLIPDVKQLTCTQAETMDNNELNIHSAPVTPIQLNMSTSTTTELTITPLCTSSNTMQCLSSPTSTIPTNHANAIIFNNLPTSTNTTIQLGSFTNTILSSSAVTPFTCTNTTINSTITNAMLNTATIITNSLLLSTVKQNELTKNLPMHSFKTLSNMVDLNVLQQSPIPFPKDYIPKLLNDTTKWTRVFQNEWAEVSIVHYGSNECQLKQQQQQQQTTSSEQTTGNNNNSMGDTSSLPRSSTASTTTTCVSCPSVSTSEVHFEHVKEELYSFFRDGLLTYSSISALFGILDKTGFQEIDQILRKSCLCDLDGPNNDGPVEWAHCVYDANYHPTCAFSIELQWLVITGGRMAELVSLWHQKAGTANLHFFPVPCYPFGNLNADLSDKDPLRKPIFLPVNISVLMETAKTFYNNQSFSVNSSMLDENNVNPNMSITDLLNYLFPDIPRSERLTCLRFFQDCILKRFGFINDTCVKDRLNFELHGRLAFTSCYSQRQWIYVHCSGGIFTMIPLYKNDDIQNEDSAKTCPMSVDASGGQKTEICQESDHNTDLLKDDNKRTINMSTTWTSLDCSANCFLTQSTIGYFWAWNHMLPKRWRGYLTGDELFQDGMLSDFRIFLNGKDGRLSQSFNDFLKTIFINHSVC